MKEFFKQPWARVICEEEANEVKKRGLSVKYKEYVNLKSKRGEHYKMILFTRKFHNAQSQAMKRKKNMRRRLGSSRGRNIAGLLDRRAGRIRDLRDYI